MPVEGHPRFFYKVPQPAVKVFAPSHVSNLKSAVPRPVEVTTPSDVVAAPVNVAAASPQNVPVVSPPTPVTVVAPSDVVVASAVKDGLQNLQWSFCSP
jgi:hypothetical protein